MYHRLAKVGACVLVFCLGLPSSTAAEPLRLAQANGELVVLPPIAPSDVLGLRSIHADVPTSVLFENTLGETVSLWWIDYLGAEVFYNTIGAMQSYQQQTFVTHPWLIRAEQTGTALVGFVPAAQPGIASIVDLSQMPTPVPEASTLVLIGTGLAALCRKRRRRTVDAPQ